MITISFSPAQLTKTREEDKHPKDKNKWLVIAEAPPPRFGRRLIALGCMAMCMVVCIGFTYLST